MKKSLFVLLFLLPLTTLAAAAAAPQDHAAIQAAAEVFMREQTLTLPGRQEIKVGAVDKRLVLPECVKLEAFLPQGAQLVGNSMVGVRCPKQALATTRPGTTQAVAKRAKIRGRAASSKPRPTAKIGRAHV